MKEIKILIIDDEPIITYSLQRYLSDKGYDVTAVTEGNKALSLLDTEDFDILLTDLKMQPVSGLEIISNLKKKNFKGRIIIMTAFCREHADEIENLKVDAILEKPFELQYLLDKIKELSK
ncbi:two-component system response regulator [Dissulfurispira thermophila]|uniref:Two-component system response regulator n=2 Tax=root TaxID=1 RepID=A0A7G1H224_9BACT|nr:response regulator [Dissulfurispira thermophila]BCB96203.1 two-component system response regulator [Dissulfurispira thermophila]